MTEFAGRGTDLKLLTDQIRQITDGKGTPRGRALIVTGRRRVGKSRLVQEFCDRSKLPYIIFQASRRRNPAAERSDFIDAVAQSPLSQGDLVEGVGAKDWNQALRALAFAAPADSPSVIVIDEVPWLVEQDPEFEGALQTVWDKQLSAKPVLLILIGSDLSIMEALQQCGRPFFGRAAHHVLRPLNPADVATMVELAPADSFDAFLITGGLPEVVQSWEPGRSRVEFLRASVANPLSPLMMAGQLTVLGEFPDATLTRVVLEVIGSGERTFTAIAGNAGAGGQLPSGTLAPILASLATKRVIATDTPLSTQVDDRNKRYRVDDPYLRFWLAFLRRGIALSERGRGDLVLSQIERSWTSWRGRAIEPVIRDSLARLMPSADWPETYAVGGWWNRQNNPEIDLVGADREPVAGRIHFAGSIKWLEKQTFGSRELHQLQRDVAALPGLDADAALVAVSRAGVADDLPLAAHWGPEELLAAWG